MTTFVVLLRGINVGKGKRVPMADLRDLLTGLGYSGVATLLNSGNAVFKAPKGMSARHAKDIADAIVARFGFAVAVVVKSAGELASIISGNPIKPDPSAHSRFLVAFAQDSRSVAALAAVTPLVAPPEKFVLGRDAAYLFCAKGILESKAAVALLGKAGKSATTRNWASVLKLQALAEK